MSRTGSELTKIGVLPDGTRGFDCNQRVGRSDAQAFYDAGYRFAVRYVRRTSPHPYDISTSEVLTLLNAGLGLMLVQHVAQEGLLGMAHLAPFKWSPFESLGKSYGATAAEEARLVGLPHGANLWCDLEGVSIYSHPTDVIAYCNAWYDSVAFAGYVPGLYVGFNAGLTGDLLYHKLKFSHYWAAYNLNKKYYPAVRGVQMQQLSYPAPTNRVHGVDFEYDEDVIKADTKGGSPLLLLPK